MKPNRYYVLVMLWTFALGVALSYRPPEMVTVDIAQQWSELLTSREGIKLKTGETFTISEPLVVNGHLTHTWKVTKCNTIASCR